MDDFYTHTVKIEPRSVSAPEDMFWHDRICRLQDPDGYIWCFATYLGEH